MDVLTPPAPATPPSGRPTPVPMETLVQVAGFVAAAVALSATGVALGANQSTGANTAADVISLLVLLAAGWAIAMTPSDQYSRMRSVFWFLAVDAFSGLAGTFVRDTLSLHGKGAGFTLGVLVTAFAAGLWWFSKRSLQAVALFLGVYITVLALVAPDTSSLNPLGLVSGSLGSLSLTGLGLAGWLVGIAILAAAMFGAFEPKRTGIAMGCIGAVAGPLFIDLDFAKLVMSGHLSWVGVVIGLGTGIALLLLGEGLGQRIASGFGIGGSLFYASTLVGVEVHDKGPGAIVMVVGLAVLAGAVLAARGVIGGGAPMPPTPMPPPAGVGSPPS